MLTALVEAEAKEDQLEPYLGLHYPASDIPRQARALYLRNWLRIIPDARYTPSPIMPPLRSDTGTPLDLSAAVLRSVSPIHLEYLANMGVRASMSISLVVADKLWGLIACLNHSAPRFVSYEQRAACEALGRLVSLQIGALEQRARHDQQRARAGARRSLVEAMSQAPREEDLLEALAAQPDALWTTLGAVVLLAHCHDCVICACDPKLDRAHILPAQLSVCRIDMPKRREGCGICAQCH